MTRELLKEAAEALRALDHDVADLFDADRAWENDELELDEYNNVWAVLKNRMYSSRAALAKIEAALKEMKANE